MHIGNGTLTLRGGISLRVSFQFGSVFQDSRAGYLLCDTSLIDPAKLQDQLRLLCDDGSDVLMAVTHSSDRYLAVTGRLMSVLTAA